MRYWLNKLMLLGGLLFSIVSTSKPNYDNQVQALSNSNNDVETKLYSGWLSTGGKISLKRENTHMFLEYRTARNLPIRREIATDWIYDPFFKYFYKYWTNHQNAVYWLILKILLDSSTYKLYGWAIRGSDKRNYEPIDWKNNLVLQKDGKGRERLKVKVDKKWEEYFVFNEGSSSEEFDALTLLYEYPPSPLYPSYISIEFFNWSKSKVRESGIEDSIPKGYLAVDSSENTIQLRHWEFVDKDSVNTPTHFKKWYQHAYVKYPVIGVSLILILGILARIGKLVLRKKRNV